MKKVATGSPTGVRNISLGEKPKRQYVPPILREYGTVADLTNGGVKSTTSDSGNNSMRPT